MAIAYIIDYFISFRHYTFFLLKGKKIKGLLYGRPFRLLFLKPFCF